MENVTRNEGITLKDFGPEFVWKIEVESPFVTKERKLEFRLRALKGNTAIAAELIQGWEGIKGRSVEFPQTEYSRAFKVWTWKYMENRLNPDCNAWPVVRGKAITEITIFSFYKPIRFRKISACEHKS